MQGFAPMALGMIRCLQRSALCTLIAAVFDSTGCLYVCPYCCLYSYSCFSMVIAVLALGLLQMHVAKGIASMSNA